MAAFSGKGDASVAESASDHINTFNLLSQREEERKGGGVADEGRREWEGEGWGERSMQSQFAFWISATFIPELWYQQPLTSDLSSFSPLLSHPQPQSFCLVVFMFFILRCCTFNLVLPFFFLSFFLFFGTSWLFFCIIHSCNLSQWSEFVIASLLPLPLSSPLSLPIFSTNLGSVVT